MSLATDGFEAPIFKLSHSPTICAIEPQPDSNFPRLGYKMLAETEYAVLDWETKLNQGLGRHPLWNMNLQKITLDKQNGFDYSKCDISVNYEPKPKDPQLQLTEVGVTYPNYSTGKARIIIYYLGVNWNIKYNSWNSGNVHFVQYTPTLQFTGFLASDPQLQETIRHELGHSFGLGHYIVSDETLYSINMGQREPPSIMLKSEMAQGVNHYDITPVDIEQVKLIYGQKGFGSPETQSGIIKNQILTNNENKLSNYDSLVNVLKNKNLPVPVCTENSTTTYRSVLPHWADKIIKFWADGIITDEDASKALVYARVCVPANG